MDQSKTVEVRIMKFSPYGSPISLVFAGQVSSRNSNGFPPSGSSGEKQDVLYAVPFLCSSDNSRATVCNRHSAIVFKLKASKIKAVASLQSFNQSINQSIKKFKVA